MAYVVFKDWEGLVSAYSIFSTVTMLKGKESNVLVIPDELLWKLDEEGIPYDRVPEDRLPEELDPAGAAYLRNPQAVKLKNPNA